MRAICYGEEDCEGGWCAFCANGHESPVHLKECTTCGAPKPQGDPNGHDYSEVLEIA